MGIDRAKRNKDGSIGVLASVSRYIHYDSDDGLGDDDYFDRQVTFNIPAKNK